MKIFQINGGTSGSTGKIMFGIAKYAKEQGYEVVCASPRTSTNRYNKNRNYYSIGTYWSRKFDVLLDTITGYGNCFAVVSTLVLLNRIKKFQPDIIHLHILHNSYVNLPLLFKFIKKSHIPIVWTLHDCWAFTGHCPYFDIVKCDKWKKHCYKCPQYKDYPRSVFDNSSLMYSKKKKWFTGIEKMMIVTPSYWLADMVKQSFLQSYSVKVINNGIDLTVFKPASSDFRNRYNISNEKTILLGVAFGWGKRKGLDVFIELVKRLEKDRYQIVLVGTDEYIDKQLPDSIISIRRTQNQQELAEIYSAADLFVNPTREENYPTVNMEAIACGTPVLTFKTGGSPEIVNDICGSVVEKDDIDALEREIIRISHSIPYSTESCVNHAKAFDNDERLQEYIDLYRELANDGTPTN